MSRHVTNLLPQVSFSILFALSLKPQYGYELMKQITHDSAGRLNLGPGALYGTLKLLNEDSLIEELPFEDEANRRRYYRLTKKGWDTLEAELEYFQNTTLLAQERRLFQ